MDRAAPLVNAQPLGRITDDGMVHIRDGPSVKLAGIAIRPIANRVLRSWVWIVPEIIGPAVEIQETGGTGSALVYYSQVEYASCCACCFQSWSERRKPTFMRASVNEMLIRVGIARFVPGEAGLPDVDRASLMKTQQDYDRHVMQGGTACELSWLVGNVMCLDPLHWDARGYVAVWDATARAIKDDPGLAGAGSSDQSAAALVSQTSQQSGG